MHYKESEGITCGFVDGDLLGAAVGLIEGAVEGALLVLSDRDFVKECKYNRPRSLSQKHNTI